MRVGTIDAEMRRRFEAAEKIPVGQTALRRPRLAVSEPSLRAHFERAHAHEPGELENPHLEPRVDPDVRARAVPASVLIGIVLHERGPTVLVTQRHHGISYPGHWVFPGGRSDAADASPQATALREAEEEIGLCPSRVEVIGRLGDYVSHSGFRIAPTVALLEPPLDLAPHPREVAAIAEIELSHLLDSSSYILYRFQDRRDRAHFALDTSTEGMMLTGVTASICIGLYSELLQTHAPSGPANESAA